MEITNTLRGQHEDGLSVSDATMDFVRQHKLDDTRRLAFSAGKSPDVDVPFALDQIEGWQTARHKLPTWAAIDGIVYPPHLNMEQCSSEQTARYKAEIGASRQMSLASSSAGCQEQDNGRGGGTNNDEAHYRGVMIDLTGGFGVDFSFLSRRFSKAIYVERNPRLCAIARHNFSLLGLSNVEVVNADGIEYFKLFTGNRPASLWGDGGGRTPETSSDGGGESHPGRSPLFVYLDPARRDVNGKKVYNVSDCEPDVVALAPLLLSEAGRVMIKLSPMFDWREAVRELPCVCEVHIVSVKNECKELLVVLDGAKDNDEYCSKDNDGNSEAHVVRPVRVHCVNDSSDFAFDFRPGSSPFSSHEASSDSSSSSFVMTDGSALPKYLFVPNASVMKAGCFTELASRYGIAAVGDNSHLFVSSRPIDDFPGRQFWIVAVSSMNKKEIRRKLAGITKANIAVRNFPMTVDALRKRLKIKDGGDVYIFATTVYNGGHVLIITKKSV